MLSAETPSTESPPQPPPIDDHFDEDEDLPDVPGEEDDEDEEDEDAGDGREPPHEFKEDTEKPVAESAEGEKRNGFKFTSSVCMMTVGIIDSFALYNDRQVRSGRYCREGVQEKSGFEFESCSGVS